PAIAAGIQPGDKIVAIDGKEIKTWRDLTTGIHGKPNTNIF
ncbi:MAG: PDZ domain-containing protein, partial [Candidatus Marinimicrobia bacterium]|nr:PDZ domain-containing protein [Candidatus Neomarinimicrobiota bacterium]